MIALATDLHKAKVLSLRQGSSIGIVGKILLEKTNLRVRLLVVDVFGQKESGYLLPDDIRLSEDKKIIIDSEEKLSNKEDLIRDQATIEQELTLFDLPVITLSGKKLGRVENYAFDSTNYLATKIYVQTSILKNLIHDNLIIDRSDIVDVKPDKLIVRDAYASDKQVARNVLPAENT